MIAAESAGAQSALQQVQVTNEVLTRARPGLDPIGARLGGFLVFPALTARIGYDDNVYDDDARRRKSMVATLEPKLSVRSGWAVHMLEFEASGNLNRYTGEPSSNFDQYQASVTGRIDIASDIVATLDTHYLRGVEPRGTAGDILIDGSPVTYKSYGSGGRLQVTLGRLILESGLSVNKMRYDDIRNGATIFSLAYRNRVAIVANGSVRLVVGPGMTGYVQAAYDRQDYDVRVPGSWDGSHGWRVLAGIDFRITQLIGGQVGIGYLTRDYANPLFRHFSGFDYSGRVVWNLTPLVTLTGKAEKSIAESPQLGISGIVRNAAEGRVDYELLRRLLVDAGVAYTTESYRGTDRVDRRSEWRVGARYLANRFAELGFRLQRRSQSSRGRFARNYTENLAVFSLTLQR
jgi:hypothetical protein